MSQSTLPLGGAAEAVEQEPEEAAPRRGRILVLAAVAAVALAGGGALLLTGGPEDVVLAASPAAPTAPAAPAATPAATPAAPADRPATAGRARDPFEALYVPPPVGGAQPPGEIPLSAPGAPVAPAQPADGSAAPAAGPPAAGAPAGSAAVGLALTRVEGPETARKAVFALDGEPVTAGVGDTFSGDLLLLSVQQGPADGQWTAVVQAGSGEPFDVVTGAPPVSL